MATTRDVVRKYLDILAALLEQAKVDYPAICPETTKACVRQFLSGGEAEVGDDEPARKLVALKLALKIAADFAGRIPEDAPLEKIVAAMD